MTRTFVAILIFASALINCGDSVKNVTIQKCCRIGETMVPSGACFPKTEPEWKFKVYVVASHSYLPRNTIPPNWRMKEASRPSCSTRPDYLELQVGNFLPFKNGTLFVPKYDMALHPNNYCIDYDMVMFCEPTRDKDITPVRKCCGKDAIFSRTNETCILLKNKSYEVDVVNGKTLTVGFPTVCEDLGILITGKLNRKNLHPENGSLWSVERRVFIPPNNYCLEHVLEDAGREPSIIVCKENVPHIIVRPTTSDIRFTIYPIGLALSSVFLAATLASGYLLPATHHILHWRCQTNHVMCLLIGDVLLCITQLTGRMAPAPCVLIAVTMHFFFLAAFFWLNTMCFNIWWTFRDLRPQSVEKSQERCRLRLYEVYAWGLPLIIAGTAAILDHVQDVYNTELLRPRFGENNCWFTGNTEKLTFFFGPIGVLLIVNLYLFALTARELTCGLWKRELVKSTTERAALGRVCMKLVVVMGVTWIADVISWAVGGPQELWYVTDIINSLQGVFIFIVIGCQPQVLSAVKRLWCMRKHGENGTAGTTNHHSSSSQGLPSMGDTLTNSITNNTTKTLPLETNC